MNAPAVPGGIISAPESSAVPVTTATVIFNSSQYPATVINSSHTVSAAFDALNDDIPTIVAPSACGNNSNIGCFNGSSIVSAASHIDNALLHSEEVKFLSFSYNIVASCLCLFQY